MLTRLDAPYYFRVAGLGVVCVAMVGCLNQTQDSGAKDSAAQPAEAAAAKVELSDIQWFDSAAELPASHPCHDSTPVLVVRYDESGDQTHEDEPLMTERTTLGEAVDMLASNWVGFGPRMVRGAKWQDARGEYLVASCNMSGAGFRAFSETRDADKKERGVFVLAAHGEPNFVKRGAIRWMHRAQDGPWKSLHEEVLWHWVYEPGPSFSGQADMLSVEDEDGNGTPEVVGVTLQDIVSSDAEDPATFCEAQGLKGSICAGFELKLVVREGEGALVQQILLGEDGSVVRVEDIARPETMRAQDFAKLSALANARRAAAITHVVGLLKQEKKLAETPQD